MLIEFHSHTNYSHGTKIYYDGVNTPEEMVKHASQIGLEAIAITDHDDITGALKAKKFEKKYDIRVILGEEIETQNGHLLAMGIQETVKPKMPLAETLDVVHQQGGIGIAAHPFDVRKKGLKELSRKCDAIEAFNAMNIDRIANLKAKRFAGKFSKPVLAGSDAHMICMLGNGITNVKSDNDLDHILKAIKKQKTMILGKYAPISVMTKYPIARLKLSYNYTFNYIEKNYHGPKRLIARNFLGLVKRSPGRIDNFFKFMGYIGFGSVIVYSGMREISGI